MPMGSGLKRENKDVIQCWLQKEAIVLPGTDRQCIASV